MKYMPAAAAAEMLAVHTDHIIHWLQTGELRGYDASKRADKKRRYRVEIASIDEFVRRRAIGPPPSKPARRRRDETVTKYY